MGEWLKHKNWGLVIWIALIGFIALNVYLGARVYTANSAGGRLQITVLDIGQGDSILVRSPDGRYGLIDGGRGSVILDQLAQFMPVWERNFAFVIGTHPDADHIEGLSSVLQRYSVDDMFWEQTQKTNTVISKLKSLVGQNQIPSFQLNADDDFKLGCCVDFDVIWPPKDYDTQGETESNNVSLTVILKYKQFQMFLGGDLPAENEEKAIESMPQSLRHIDVLKVSHHGSKYSTSAKFLNLIDTQIALISVGTNNTYGHPAPQVLQNLKQAGVEVFRTDEDGPIQLQTDGNTLEIKASNRLENLELKD